MNNNVRIISTTDNQGADFLTPQAVKSSIRNRFSTSKHKKITVAKVSFNFKPAFDIYDTDGNFRGTYNENGELI